MNISKGRILCTEDEADVRDLLAFVLGQQGYEVECTESAEDALAHARDESFDLFLFDNWLPGMSGIELTRKVRTFNFKTPILFCSGVAYGKDQDEARKAGAQRVLGKAH